MASSLVAGYCNRCDAEREIILTVPWQDDVCVRCGDSDVEVPGDQA